MKELKRRKGRKSNQIEYEQRIPELLHMMIVEHLSYNEFIRKVAEYYDVTKRTGANWWKDLRKRLKDRYEQEGEEIIQEQIQRYFNLYQMAESKGNTRVMREVLADLNNLYGLNKPNKVDLTSGSEPIKINLVFDK